MVLLSDATVRRKSENFVLMVLVGETQSQSRTREESGGYIAEDKLYWSRESNNREYKGKEFERRKWKVSLVRP